MAQGRWKETFAVVLDGQGDFSAVVAIRRESEGRKALPMPRPDIRGDARRAFDVIKGGGIGILPMDVGYSAIGGSAAALKTIFDTKQRVPSKLNAMVADCALHRDIHIVDQRGAEIVACLTEDYDLPVGAIAPARMDHPLLTKLTSEAVNASQKDGTIVMLLNAGPFHAEITRLSREEVHPLFGSSANVSMTGAKFRVEDIEPQIKAIADVIIDHGLRKYHCYKASSTLLNVMTLEVVRIGSCHEIICDVLKRHFQIDLLRA
ncbi:MAG: Sua5/YciO/YrdC/YwlC family protein [Rhodospirillaceae bacterium]|nr:Sua5/YciO/YrdC/YwlC family protein [Rhodospirillaceae bacterium]